jgi:cytochrome c-type biogenesis protein CcmH/NrfG
MKMGRFEDAEKRAGEALALAPSSAEIKSTVAEIAVARAATKPKTTKDSKPVGRPVPQDAL